VLSPCGTETTLFEPLMLAHLPCGTKTPQFEPLILAHQLHTILPLLTLMPTIARPQLLLAIVLSALDATDLFSIWSRSSPRTSLLPPVLIRKLPRPLTAILPSPCSSASSTSPLGCAQLCGTDGRNRAPRSQEVNISREPCTPPRLPAGSKHSRTHAALLALHSCLTEEKQQEQEQELHDSTFAQATHRCLPIDR
jgi:hypothetical protein